MVPCPPRDELQRFLTGSLAETIDADLAAHVEQCGQCQQVLEELTGAERPTADRAASSDTDFLRRLKKTPPPDVEICQALARASLSKTFAEGHPAASTKLPVVRGYELLGELGRGGMGVVYKARQLGLNRCVALKMILSGPHSEGDGDALRRFRAEAELAARLQHPNIVQIHEIGEQDGRPFMSLELVEGGSLAKRLGGQPQPPLDAARLVGTLARAVHFAHEHGIVHRDLKPSNILLTEGEPKIGDFGLAKLVADESGRTRTGIVLGTPRYMAPEQAAGDGKGVGRTADVYALGAILYECLTGRPPFDGATALETIHNLRTQEPVPPRRLRSTVPLDLNTVCLKCLEKEPGRRYADARALADDLGRFLDGKALQARPVHVAGRLWRWCKRNRPLAALATATAMLLVLVAIGALGLSWALWDERDAARFSECRARSAEQDAEHSAADARAAEQLVKDQLRAVSLARAQARRHTGQPGRRFDALALIAQAATDRPDRSTRNEAIACLALTDIRRDQEWTIEQPESYRGAFDAALERYATGDADGTITVRRRTDNRELLRLPGPGVPAWRMQFSPTGRFLAAKHHPRYEVHDDIYVWDLQQPEAERRPVLVHGRTWDFSPAPGREGQLALAQDDGSIVFYDAANRTKLRTTRSILWASWLAFDPEGKRLAVIGGTVALLLDVEAADVPQLARLDHAADVHSAGWSRDGKQLAVACDDSTIALWRLDDPRFPLPRTLARHDGAAVYVAFNKDGDLLASTGWDNTLRLWDVHNGVQIVNEPAIGWPPQFSPDGRLLGHFDPTGSKVTFDAIIQPPEFRTLDAALPASQRAGVYCLSYSPDSRLLVATAGDGVHFWDPAARREITPLRPGDFWAAQVNPSGHGLVFNGSKGAHVRSLRIESGADAVTIEVGKLGPVIGDPTRRDRWGLGSKLSMSRDGDVLAIAQGSSRALILRGERLNEQLTLKLSGPLYALALSPDGEWAATSAWHSEHVRVWNARTGAGQDLGATGDAALAFSPDGLWLAAGTGSEYLLWRVGDWQGQPRRLPRDYPGTTTGHLAFSGDGKLLAIAPNPRTVRLVDPATGDELATLEAPVPSPISAVCFNAEGTQLAVACVNQVIQLWDIRRIRQRLAERNLDWR